MPPAAIARSRRGKTIRVLKVLKSCVLALSEEAPHAPSRLSPPQPWSGPKMHPRSGPKMHPRWTKDAIPAPPPPIARPDQRCTRVAPKIRRRPHGSLDLDEERRFRRSEFSKVTFSHSRTPPFTRTWGNAGWCVPSAGRFSPLDVLAPQYSLDLDATIRDLSDRVAALLDR